MTGFNQASARTSIFQALLDASKVYGRKTPILEDPERNPLSYARIVLLFDGEDEDAVAAARARWSQAKAQGFEVTYWQPNEQGKWKKAG